MPLHCLAAALGCRAWHMAAEVHCRVANTRCIALWSPLQGKQHWSALEWSGKSKVRLHLANCRMLWLGLQLCRTTQLPIDCIGCMEPQAPLQPACTSSVCSCSTIMWALATCSGSCISTEVSMRDKGSRCRPRLHCLAGSHKPRCSSTPPSLVCNLSAVAKPLPLSELSGWGFSVPQLEQQVRQGSQSAPGAILAGRGYLFPA